MDKAKLSMRTLPKHLVFSQQLAPDIRDSLSNSCAASLSVKELCQLADVTVDFLFDTPLTYASIRGNKKLRKYIAQFHQSLNHHCTALTEHNVLNFCGAQEALAAAYRSILVKGDHVVVVTPCYPSIVDMAKQLECQVSTIELLENNGWRLSIDNIKAALKFNTKLIVLNSPHNPSGSIITSELADEILAIVQEHECYLISDDVSQASNYYQLPLSHTFLDYDKAISIGVISKSFGLSGVRLGWAVSKNKALLENMLAIKSYGSICCSLVDEQIALLAFECQNKILQRNNELISDNILLFKQFVTKNHDTFSWYAPQAGMLALVKVNTCLSIDNWCRKLAQNTGILVLPAHLFGGQHSYFRLGLGQSNFKQLLDKLTQFLNSQQ